MNHELTNLDTDQDPRLTAMKVAAQHRIRIYLQEDLSPCFKWRRGDTRHRVLICSIPKSGTYLFGALLTKLSVEPCEVHLREEAFTDYRFVSLDEQRSQHKSLDVHCPIASAVPLILPGQFAVGHVVHNSGIKDIFKDFRIIFTFRDLRDCMVSQMRFYAKNKRRTSVSEGWGTWPDGPERMKGYLEHEGEFFLRQRAAPLLPWLDEPNVLALSYEEVMGDYGTAKRQDMLSRLLDFLELPEPGHIEDVLAAVFGTETMTSSGKRTERTSYWDDEVEAFFSSHGGPDMNRRLGYAG